MGVIKTPVLKEPETPFIIYRTLKFHVMENTYQFVAILEDFFAADARYAVEVMDRTGLNLNNRFKV